MATRIDITKVLDTLRGVIEEECFSDIVSLDSVTVDIDYYRRKEIYKFDIRVASEEVANSESFKVLCKRIAQFFSKMMFGVPVGFYDTEFMVRIDNKINSVKIDPVAEYVKNDVNMTMEVSKNMAQFRVPDVVEIIHRTSDRGEFFTVIWSDNDKTTVKLMEGDTSDEYTAFLYALGKKMFGDKGTARKFVREKKEVFESRMEAKSREKAKKRLEAEFMKQVNEFEDDSDIAGQVYGEMFVAPALISKALFKKNKGGRF